MKKKVIFGFTFLLVISLGALGIIVVMQNNEQDEEGTLVDNIRSNRNVQERLELVEEVVEEYQLERLSQADGLEGLNETVTYVEVEEGENTKDDLETDQISNFQTYVTPNSPAVASVATGKSYEDIYKEAVSWTWVEDDIINGVSEKWLYPEIFLTQTPTFATNPVPGRIASDCESQAYTLVSALRAAGMPAENVRVVTGLVNFGGNVGGHAWVEVFEDGEWFALEATSGNYYDSASGEFRESSGLDYDYFKTYRYPSVQIWNYFNDAYFYDLALSEGNAPDSWLDDQSTEQAPSAEEVTYEIPEYLEDIRDEVLNRKESFIENNDIDEEEVRATVEETIEDVDLEDVTVEDIENAILDIINKTEELVEEGLTEEQRQAIQDEIIEAIDQAYVLVEQSNLSADQKFVFNSYLKTIEGYVNRGLTQLQRTVIQNEILNGLEDLEEKIANN